MMNKKLFKFMTVITMVLVMTGCGSKDLESNEVSINFETTQGSVVAETTVVDKPSSTVVKPVEMTVEPLKTLNMNFENYLIFPDEASLKQRKPEGYAVIEELYGSYDAFVEKYQGVEYLRIYENDQESLLATDGNWYIIKTIELLPDGVYILKDLAQGHIERHHKEY